MSGFSLYAGLKYEELAEDHLCSMGPGAEFQHFPAPLIQQRN